MNIEDLIADQQLQLELVTDPTEPALKESVRSVVSTESISPEGLSEPNTLLLTTGQSMRFENEQIWAAYVERLKLAQVSAVAFSLGTIYTCVPRNLCRAANKAGLPVVSIPSQISPIQVQQSINRLLSEERYWASRRAWALATKCIAVLTRNGGLDELLRIIVSDTGTEVGIYDDLGHHVAGSYKNTVLPIREVDTLSLVVDGNTKWNLVVPKHSLVSLGPAATVVNMAISKKLQTMGSQYFDKGKELATALKSAGNSPVKEVDRALEQAGFLPGIPISIVRISAHSSARRNLIAFRIIKSLKYKDVVVGSEANGLVLLYISDRSAETSVINWDNLCEKEAGDSILFQSDISGAAEVLLSYRNLCESPIEPGAQRCVVPGLDMVINGICPEMGDAAARRLLEPILSEKEAPRFLATLKQLIQTQSLSQAAMELGVHRNTLRRDRIKMEKLIGRRLETPLDLAPYAIALRIYDRSPW
ncbi:hypothetical protein GP475_11040 [Corynebacterium poyangense]|uniref:Uncharacterized protein n=1 Tax=Corynebacterium poyangense TaxID=2684405 RepID=A0A7H0SRD0_9CORY|nr:PucR family transcriptional regulator ligand-binding domain-containing protein [Corynebacterium poyangense]MBZ8176539.1 hypothetical protein [Corynebacterium poyangense]QNQ91105.1 hypothetical protein GP475_11040 [Corynebacterium poyangense]